jgi:YVTN family beta-propeller protein
MRTLLYLLLLALPLGAADYRTPAGTRAAQRTEAGPGTILPGGRLLTPYGTEYTTGPGPFGLAISPAGSRIVTADGGPDRFSLSFLERHEDEWTLRRRQLARKRDADKAGADKADADDWTSTFMGLAFGDENTLYASEGESGQVRVMEPSTGRTLHVFKLNAGGYKDSYSGDLALDTDRGILYVVDQANFRVAIFDTKTLKPLGSAAVGRLPFAATLSPDRRRLYVTNVGMFRYRVVPGADAKKARETGLEFPAFGFPSKQAMKGVKRKNASGQKVDIAPLGDPNVPESNSLAVVDVSDPAQARIVKFIRTGLPFGRQSQGGSSPAGVLAAAGKVFVSNGSNDTISVINPGTLTVEKEIFLRIPGLEKLRGVLPVGMAFHAATNRILVAEAGIDAVGVIDLATMTQVAQIPAGWFPTRVALDGNMAYVTNAKGHGIGPNATLDAPMPNSFQAERRRGSLSRYTMPAADALPALTKTALENNGFLPAATLPAVPAAELPKQIRHVVIIVKENRTFDEVFGDVAGAPKLARFGRGVTPNHHAIAERWAMSDNFYADSEVSVDGHHWLVGSYPNEWTESTLMAAYGGAKSFRLNDDAPGRLEFPESNSSVHPEDTLEAGSLWHHLGRGKITFRNFGEGFELAGVNEGTGLKPTGGRYLTNVPMPDPLYRNTSRVYPNYNTNIPDQFRATQFIGEIETLYRKPGNDLPHLLYIHLPDDHTAKPRPEDGYPVQASYVADNDYALGRIIEYLSHSPWWKDMAVFVTEDDAQGGVDHVDSHRTVMLVAGPYVKPGYVAHTNSSFPGMLKTVFRVFGLPPLNLYDAAAADLSECFTTTPDFRPFTVLPVDKTIFDPANAREPLDPKPQPKMDDPKELKRQHDR